MPAEENEKTTFSPFEAAIWSCLLFFSNLLSPFSLLKGGFLRLKP